MKKAFTLIEVLVVVAIIALLIAVLVPSLLEARDLAKSAKCLANMKDMGIGINTFKNAHQNRFQIICYPWGQQQEDPDKRIFAYESGGLGQLLGYPLVLLREAGTRSLARNKDWGIVGSQVVANRGKIRHFELMMCPADKHLYGTFGYPFEGSDNPANYYFGHLSYGINMDVVGVYNDADTPGPNKGGIWKDGHPSNSVGAGRNLAGRMDKIIRPSEVVMLADAGSQKPLDQMIGDPGIPLFFGTSGPTQNKFQSPRGPYLEYVDRQYSRKLRPDRHPRHKLNLNYADGHGGSVQYIGHNPLFAPYDPTLGQMPNFMYSPKVRVSPFNPGAYPAAP